MRLAANTSSSSHSSSRQRTSILHKRQDGAGITWVCHMSGWRGSHQNIWVGVAGLRGLSCASSPRELELCLAHTSRRELQWRSSWVSHGTSSQSANDTTVEAECTADKPLHLLLQLYWLKITGQAAAVRSADISDITICFGGIVASLFFFINKASLI